MGVDAEDVPRLVACGTNLGTNPARSERHLSPSEVSFTAGKVLSTYSIELDFPI